MLIVLCSLHAAVETAWKFVHCLHRCQQLIGGRVERRDSSMSKIPLPEKQGVLMEVARTLGNSLKVCEKHYANWVQSRQAALDSLVENVESIGSVLRKRVLNFLRTRSRKERANMSGARSAALERLSIALGIPPPTAIFPLMFQRSGRSKCCVLQ